MKNISLITLAAAWLLSASYQAHAQIRDTAVDRPTESKFTVQLNPEYATGKYGGSTDIEDQYLGLGLRYDSGAWTFKATLPYLQTSSDRAFTRIEPGQIQCRRSGTECTTSDPTTITTTAKQTQTGFADLGASVTYHFPVIGDGLNVDIIGRGKFDTASKGSGLGSGRNDFSLATGWSYETKSWEPYVELGYKWRGKSDDPDLLNQSALTAGAKFFFDRSSSIDFAYDVRSKSFDGDPSARSASVAVSSRLNRNWKLEGYYIHGLTDVVADRVIGVGMAYRY
jgi:hypothetical protein